MAGLKIKIDLSDLKRLEQQIKDAASKVSRSGLQKAADQLETTMKSQIAKGISPIRGNGRFPEYKNAGVKGRYPDSARDKFPNKRQRPVNLFLSGDMLDDLDARALTSEVIEVGYSDSKQAQKERDHRDGANGQPKRPTIPQGAEEFNQTIQLELEDSYATLLDKAVELETKD